MRPTKKEPYTIFEDQEDYVEDIKEKLSAQIKRYTLYNKMFADPVHWKLAKDELKRFINYEIERAHSLIVIRETKDGGIQMKFHEPDDLN
jgi:hypothetical protein